MIISYVHGNIQWEYIAIYTLQLVINSTRTPPPSAKNMDVSIVLT